MVESSAETAIPAEERMTSAEERAIFAEGRAQQAEENLLSQGQGDRFDRWIEFFSAIALALATVLTAWCGYQAALWGGEQTQATSDATDATALRCIRARPPTTVWKAKVVHRCQAPMHDLRRSRSRRRAERARQTKICPTYAT